MNKPIINPEQAKEIAKEAVKEYIAETKVKTEKQILHNTQLLMKHYKSLKLFADNAVYKMNDITERKKEDRIYITSIMRSRIRTVIMVNHIEYALEELRKKKDVEGRHEHYDALMAYYVNNMTLEQIADGMNCGQNTPSRWINAALKDLSVLLFGAEGMRLEDMIV